MYVSGVNQMAWDVADATALAKRLGVFPSAAEVVGSEIGDGNLNYVFRLIDVERSKSVVVKKAVPFVRLVGDSWPLTEARCGIEWAALQFEASVIPDRLPGLYAYSSEEHALIMEDLSHLDVLRPALNRGIGFPKLASHIGIFLARTLFFSSDRAGDVQTKKQRMAEMVNPELCGITEALVLTDPFYEAESNRIAEGLEDVVEDLWRDQEVTDKVFVLRDRFMTLGQALLHGDLHTGSVMVGSGDTRVIDPEFAFYGPMGFDIGLFLGNIFLNMLAHTARGDSREFVKYLDLVARQTWDTFYREFVDLWESGSYDNMFRSRSMECAYMDTILRDSAGYAGCESIRRTIGLAQVSDLTEISDDAKRRAAQQHAILLGSDLIRGYDRVQDFSDVMALVHTRLDELAHLVSG